MRTPKIHFGCGKRVIPGWFHVDIADFPHIDANNLDHVGEGYAEVFYACHVLEHFSREEIPDVLKEWKRALKRGGTLRLAVPDFTAWAAVYTQTHDLALVHGAILGGQKDATDFHKTLFTYRSLNTTLEDAGFCNIQRWDWRETEHAHVDDYSQSYYPHMDKEHGRLMSLNIEATKP